MPAELLLPHGQVAAAAEVHPEERDNRVDDDDADRPLGQAQGRDALPNEPAEVRCGREG